MIPKPYIVESNSLVNMLLEYEKKATAIIEEGLKKGQQFKVGTIQIFEPEPLRSTTNSMVFFVEYAGDTLDPSLIAEPPLPM